MGWKKIIQKVGAFEYSHSLYASLFQNLHRGCMAFKQSSPFADKHTQQKLTFGASVVFKQLCKNIRSKLISTVTFLIIPVAKFCTMPAPAA